MTPDEQQRHEDWIRNNPRDALGNLASRIDRAQRHIPDTFTHLAEQLYIIDNLRSTWPTGTGSHSGAISNPTLTTYTNRNEVMARRDIVLDGIITLDVCVRMVEDSLRKAQTVRAEALEHDTEDPDHEDPPRCIGDGTPDGAVCHQIPIPRTMRDGSRHDDGRCLDCGARWDIAEAERRIAADERRARRYAQKGAA